MPAIEIRPAVPDDIPAITEIYADEVRERTATFELDAPDVEEMRRRYTALADGGFPYLVASSDSVIVGYAYVGPFRPRPAYRFTVENSIYLAPAFQRRGIGLLLLEELIARSTASGLRQMVAVIGDSANQGSIQLHTRAGFKMIGTLQDTGFKFGRWLDTVLMQRALGEGSTTAGFP